MILQINEITESEFDALVNGNTKGYKYYIAERDGRFSVLIRLDKDESNIIRNITNILSNNS